MTEEVDITSAMDGQGMKNVAAYIHPTEMSSFKTIHQDQNPPMPIPKASGMDYEVVIIGAGFSGILSAIKLKDVGVPIEDTLILDSAPDLGGVWCWNRYPGAAVDVQAYYYFPMLGRTKFIPSKKYVNQEEIQTYQKLLSSSQGIDSRFQFNTLVTKLKFVESRSIWEVHTARCNKDDQLSSVATGERKMITCRHCVMACGPIAVPHFPRDVADMEKFRGPIIHSSRWDFTKNLTGKRVGLIGVGASAGQIITSTANGIFDVEKLFVFQRTPSWCLPRDDGPTTEEMADELKKNGNHDMTEIWMRNMETTFYDLCNDLTPNGGNDQLRQPLEQFIRSIVNDKKVAELLVPKIPFFGKRPLILDDYYQAYNSPKVKLVADPGGVVRLTENEVVTADGRRVEVDAVVCATGFDCFNISVDSVIGRGGESLHEKWGGANHRGGDTPGNPRTVFGIHIVGFPNLYVMIGPQTLNPATNVSYLCERQADYIGNIVHQMRTEGIPEVDVSEEYEKDWEQICRKENKNRVWGACDNWYNKEGTIDDAANYWGKMYDYFDYIEERKEKALMFAKLSKL